ncbi:MAG: S8 family serine peptidase [Acidobacteria bacterium]|nr:S8 family serine peptidase [Acidobacteriota bacterium]
MAAGKKGGVAVPATRSQGAWRGWPRSKKSYASWSGASMATSHVTGAIALIKQSKPGATVGEI